MKRKRSHCLQEIGDLRLVGIAHDKRDSRENRKLFWSALSVAAGDDDLRGRIGGVEFADGVARLRVGGSGDRARVQDDDVGLLAAGCEMAALFAQLPFDGGSIGLRCAAAKLFDVKRGHDRKTRAYLLNASSNEPSRLGG